MRETSDTQTHSISLTQHRAHFVITEVYTACLTFTLLPPHKASYQITIYISDSNDQMVTAPVSPEELKGKVLFLKMYLFEKPFL
jgi:hypothetical protein